MSSLNEQLKTLPSNLAKENQFFSSQTADRQRYYQPQLQNKNEEDFDHIQITSPTQNLVFDDSLLFHQQKKKCLCCIQSQKKMQEIQNELQNQKKKNVKYLKIINTKIDKERELQAAYYQIAKQLKKKKDAAQSFQLQQICKEKQQNDLTLSTKNRWKQLINQLQQKNLRIIHQNIDYQLQFKVEKDINRLHFLSFQIISYKGFSAKRQGFRPQIDKQEKISISQLKQRESEQERQIQNFILKQQQQLKKANKQEELSYQTVKQWSSQHFSSVNISKSINQGQKQMNEFEVNKSEQQQIGHLKRDSSYYSIKQDLQIVQISNVSIKNSLSIEETNRKSQKSFLNQLIQQKSQIKAKSIEKQHLQKDICFNKNLVQRHSIQDKLLRQIDEQREKVKHFVFNIKQFLEKINNQLNIYGYKYKIYSKLPKCVTNYTLISTNKTVHMQDILIQKDKIQEILILFTEQLESTFKRQQKQYQKMLNDKDLIIYNTQSKANELQIQKKQSQKIIENYQMHKSILQIKFMQLQQKINQIGQVRQVKQVSTNRSQYVSQLRKRVSIMISERSKNKETQCDILAEGLIKERQNLQFKNHQLIEALNQVPLILNEICAKKLVNDTFTINFQDNLQRQLSQMLRTSYQHLKAEQVQSPQLRSCHSITRLRSASLSLSPKLFRKGSQNNQGQVNRLQLENAQLRNILQQKSSQLLKCSQKVSLFKIEKTSIDKEIEELKDQNEQLSRLNRQLQSKKCNHGVIKNEMGQSRMKNSRISVRGSQKGQFMQYQQKKEYNNLYWDRDEQLKQLKIKIEKYEQQLKKFRLLNKKKKKTVYIDR